MTREDLLSQSWTGPPLELNGRELTLSLGGIELLRRWRNPLVTGADSDSSPFSAVAEIALVCYSDKAELIALRKMTEADRGEAVLDFMLENDGEMLRLQDGILERLKAMTAAAVESETPGKEQARAD